MRPNNAEVITNKNAQEALTDIKVDAEIKVQNIEQEALEAEEMERSLEMDLLEAQAAHETKEEAERQGKETNEKIGELG